MLAGDVPGQRCRTLQISGAIQAEDHARTAQEPIGDLESQLAATTAQFAATAMPVLP